MHLRDCLPLLGCSILLGCTPPPEPPPAPIGNGPIVVLEVCVDTAFVVDDRVAIYRACAAWTVATCRLMHLQPHNVDGYYPPEECDITVLRSTTGEGLSPRAPAACCPTEAPTTIWIADRWVPPRGMQAIATHEIGHTLGVPHGDGIMAPTLTDWDASIDRRSALIAVANTTRTSR